MMWIELIMHMSGTRANGDRYPPGFTPFPVDDWEGEHLIRGGMAREVNTPEWAVPKPPPPLESPASIAVKKELPPDAGRAFLPEDEPEDDDPAQAPALQDAQLPPLGSPPAPAAPKQAWVDYAASQGMNADDAARMTKADLQSRYGPRL